MAHPADSLVHPGKIITFYSYKGGTGRSMALANVAWILASAGKRVLMIDWDLEAPGLHRYFHPFLLDKNLTASPGIIDFMVDFASAALTQPSAAKSEPSATPAPANSSDRPWFYSQADLLRYAVSLRWQKFPKPGTLDFVPAGRQDLGYPIRVNSFSWKQFYENLGGGIFLEAAKDTLRREYDYTLIDSRTGVSDTSGICTIQMPDELVVCFTLNSQSIDGAAAAAKSALDQRTPPKSKPSIKVWPVPMRVEPSEKDRLERARTLARTKFNFLLNHLSPEQQDRYWGEIEVTYEPYYAYEEVLSTFADRPRQKSSLLSKMEVITRYLSDGSVKELQAMQETERRELLSKYTDRPVLESAADFLVLAQEYEQLRERMPSGNERTYQMNALVDRVQTLAGDAPDPSLPEQLFTLQTPGARIVALAIAQQARQPRLAELATRAISESRSAFEQYHGLVLAQQLMRTVDAPNKDRIRQVVKDQIGKFITRDDRSRWDLSQTILKRPGAETPRESHDDESVGVQVGSEEFVATIGNTPLPMVEISAVGAPIAFRDSLDEQHGPFVVTKGLHTIRLLQRFRVATQLVTNELFLAFVADGGYANKAFWNQLPQQLLTSEADGLGPSLWISDTQYPEHKANHPVAGISFLEARAFCRWLQFKFPPGDGNWKWCLPPEDAWELAARGQQGLAYPWGPAFEIGRCNSSESGLGDTSPTGRFPSGASPFGCQDMAGNVWEFVEAERADSKECVLRGGSYGNNQLEVRSYLRLIHVPAHHRPPDFGFRCAQLETADKLSPALG